MDPILAVFLILAAAVIAFLSGKVPMDLVAIGVAILLWATGVLSLPDALSGFSNPTVIFIAALFVVSESLDATGVTAWVGQKVIGSAGTGRARLIVIIGLLSAALTALISINGAVAALVPVVVVVALRAGLVPSRLLVPLAFAASAGSLLTLTGTPVNIVVSDAAADNGGRAFGFFEFALAGVPLLALTVLFLAVFGNRLIPERTPATLGGSDHTTAARALRDSYQVPVETGRMFTAREGVAEMLVAPRSSFIGREITPGMRTRQENLVILAVRRGAEEGLTASTSDQTGSITLAAGDALLVQGPWDALERYAKSPDVLAVTPPQTLQRAVPLGRGAKRSIVILGLMIVVLATGILPPAIAGLLAAAALIASRVMTIGQTYRAISWTTIVLIAGMMPLSDAFVSTGAADVVADVVLNATGGASPHLALLILCAVTIVFSQFISNVATVLIVIPIAVSVAATSDLSIMPFMMALTVAGAAAFLTPVATPANMMIMQPGGLRFGDYWKAGLPLTLIFLAVAVLYVPLIWPF